MSDGKKGGMPLGLARLVVVPAALVILVLVIVGFAYDTPTDYFRNPFYWVGFAFFFTLAWILVMNLQSKLLPRVGAIIFIASIFTGVLVSNTYEDALVFVSGFIGMFVGIGVRGGILIATQARWHFCNECGESTWFAKRGGSWVCRKHGHALNQGSEGIAKHASGSPVP
jgi:hypothetical protein